MTFKELTVYIKKKYGLDNPAKQTEATEKQASEIETKIEKTEARIQAERLFRQFVGKYFKRLNKGSYEYKWFRIVDIPRSGLSIYSTVLGYDFDEYIIPVKFMQLDGTLRIGPVSSSINDLRDKAIEITEDEWFDEQKRRAHQASMD